jgi:hypothetical protein
LYLFSIRNLGDEYIGASQDLKRYNQELDRNAQKLNETANEADKASNSISGVGRASKSLGAVVQGDVDDPANIQRALNRLNAQLRQVSLSGAGGANRIQARILRAEIDRLEADFTDAVSQFRQDTISSIVNSISGLSGDDFQEEVARQIALQEKLGILPTASSSNPGFQTMTVG